MALNHLWEAHGEEVEELIFLLVERLVEESELSSCNFQTVLILTQSLSNIPARQGLKVLRGSDGKGLNQRSRLVENIVLANVIKSLEDKLPTCDSGGNQEQTHVFASKLIEAAGPSFAQYLVSIIAKIDPSDDLECFVQLLAKAKLQFEIGSLDGKYGRLMQNNLKLPNSQKTLHELIQSIRMRLLIAQIPSKLLMCSRGVENDVDHRLEDSIMCLLEQGLSMSQLEKFFQLSVERCGDKPIFFAQIVHHILSQAVQYGLNQPVFDNVIAALTNPDLRWTPSDCFDTMNSLVNNHIFADGSDSGGGASHGALKHIDSLIGEFCDLNEHMQNLNADMRMNLKKLLLRISAGKEPSKMLCEQSWTDNSTHICDWDAELIGTWATKAKAFCAKQVSSQERESFLIDALMIAKQACLLTKNFHMTYVQLMACYFGICPGQESESSTLKGTLVQVATGSGKSAIIGVIAVIKSLLGNPVDVYTSSPVLAERDSKEWSQLYSLFGLECSHNGDKYSSYISGPKPCYTKSIVYGECAQFQFDYLRHSYSNLGTRGERGFGWAVIDEVDAMFIDDPSKLARLSSSLPGMDLLHLIYQLLWHRLEFIHSHIFSMYDQLYYMEGQLNTRNLQYSFADAETQELKTVANLAEFIIGGGDLAAARIQQINPLELESFVTKHLSAYALELVDGNSSIGAESQVKLPQNLKKFAESQIENWVSSAMTAVAYRENVHYIVHNGQIKPVDFATTGIVQGNTSWNNGLHQFLQLKHGLRLSSESVTTNFLSNLAIFQKYGSMVGFTGTLGSDVSRTVLRQVYNVQMLVIPAAHTKRNVRFPDLVTGVSEHEWLRKIVTTTLEEVSKHRGVLIICETIREADKITEALSCDATVKVKLYTKNEEHQEQHIERIHKGDVIVATNLAGRGTDIKTTEIEANGGLHVILTFLPPSLRVEEQAFGRTSRQGNVGTGQLIIRTSAVTDTQKCVKQLLDERNRLETEGLFEFQKKQLPVIQTKDKLFEQFSECLDIIRKQIRDNNPWNNAKELVGWTAPTQYEVTILQAVEERWAMFLRQINNGCVNEKEAQDKYNVFKNQLMSDMGSGLEKLIRRGQNPFYFVQLGNVEYLHDSKLSSTLDKASRYFDAAVDLDPHFAVGAYVGKAYILLKGQVKLIRSDKHEKEYKLGALELLTKAMGILQEELAILQVQQMLVHQSGNNTLSFTRGMECPLFHQLTDRTNLLGSYIKSVETIMITVEKSLRRVYCTVTDKDPKKTNETKTTCLETHLPIGSRQIPKPCDYGEPEYLLNFHDLTSFKDGNDIRDQAIDTLAFKSATESNKTLYEVSMTTSGIIERKKRDLKRFTIGLYCTDVDVGEIGIELAKRSFVGSKKWQVNVELISLPLDLVKLELYLNKLNASNDKLKPKSHSMKVMVRLIIPVKGESNDCRGNVGCWNELHTLLTSPDVLGCAIELRVVLTTPMKYNGVEVLAIPVTIHKVIEPEIRRQQLSEFQTQFSGNFLESVKCFSLTSSDTVEATSKQFSELQPPQHPWTFNLTLECLIGKLEEWINAWTSCLQHMPNGVNLHFEYLTEDDARIIIPILRSKRVEFLLLCSELNFDTAEFILKNANLNQEDILQSEVKELLDLFMYDCLPLVEIVDLSARGISVLATFNERKFVPWTSIATVLGLAAVQAAAGGALICTGFGATVGIGLITEGMADLVTAQRIYATREFSWSSYGTQKAVSLVISAVSMGLSSLKDGAKGVAMIVEGAASEVAEQAATRVLTNGKLLNTTIAIAGKNLRSLAVKQTTASIVETGARIVLTEAANGLAKFTFEQVKGDIVKKVEDNISTSFRSTQMSTLFRYHWAVDKNGLLRQINVIVDRTVNPKATGWLQLWNDVGGPLTNGILASPQFVGSAWTRMTMIGGMVMGSQEIITVIDRVCQEICKQLQEAKRSHAELIQSACGISEQNADLIAQQMTFKTSGKTCEQSEFELENILRSEASIPEKEYKDAEEYFKTLKKSWSDFKFDDNIELSQAMKQIVDKIANHIIRTANSHLLSPITSSCVGSVLTNISAELQDRFLTSVDENADEQNTIMGKVETLKIKKAKGNKLTAEESTFLQQNDVGTTFRRQILGNAKAYTIDYQRRRIVHQALQVKSIVEAKEKEQGAGMCDWPSNAKQSAYVVGKILIDKAPADMSIISSLATVNNIDVKIVDDPQYLPTEAEKAAGTNIILCEKSADGDIGHYSLKGLDEIVVIKGGYKQMDCGYAVLAHLTSKSVDEMRLEAAELILNNPYQFAEIKNASDWMRERYPWEVNDMLSVGGKQTSSQKDQKEGADNKEGAHNCKKRERDRGKEYENQREKCEVMLKKDSVQKRLEVLTTTEATGGGQGYVYVIRVAERFNSDTEQWESVYKNEKNHIKVGLAINVDKRLKAMKVNNKEKYEVLGAVETPYRFSTEKVTHEMLSDYHEPRSDVDGKTEYFRGKWRLFL